MPSDVIMPALGMAQETGKVLRWLKADGDAVAKGEPLLEIETDKVNVDIEAPADGTLAAITAREGDEVPVGTVIALVLAEGEVAPETRPAADGADEPVLAIERPHRPLASPKARRLAVSRGIDLAALAGSGPNGAVVAADVEAAVTAPARDGSGTPVGSLWRLMAERTQRAWQEVPQFVLTREVDAARLLSWRAAARSKPGCENLSITDLLVRISAEALRRHSRLAASWHDGALVAGAGIHIGIAVATEEGLVVPVVHDVDALALAAISSRRRELAEAARAARLRPEDVQGGVFTISNLGMYGVDAFQAIVNAPQAAILAVGRIVERPAALNGEVVVRPMLTLTVSYDHRVADGARGAEFLDTLASLVEEPAGLVE
jgi:pyruvate dehydrogenase E2 component (dihydrolipoamide acetyltransferase)